MTILQALDGYYARMAARGEAEAPGWSREKFGWCVVIDAEGEPVRVVDLHDNTGKKPRQRLIAVPAPKRTSNVKSNFLWDKTAYSFGVTAGEGRRIEEEHAAFRNLHLTALVDANDAGLKALHRFVERWRPDRFRSPPFHSAMLDQNIVFRLEGTFAFIHECEEAAQLTMPKEMGSGATALCLITGEQAVIEEGHPVIKNVRDAQSSGAYLISYNKDAFESYGKKNGANAPTSKLAAHRYGNALNRLLASGGANSIQIGDATTIFWADASEATPEAAEALDGWFGGALSMEVEDAAQARKIGDELEAVAKGRPLTDIHPDLTEGVRFHVLGLAPNAARLSVRYWLSDDFRAFAQRLADHYADLRIEPVPWRTPPSVNRLLVRTTALGEKFENIPPLLAGETMRAVLGGGRYPQSLIATVLTRLRAGDPKPDQNGRKRDIGWHAAVLRAVLHRKQRRRRGDPDIPEEGETPVALRRDHNNTGYQLGRLFAVYELAQVAALGRKVNATIRDKYFGGAAATPAGVFPLVIKNGQNHLSKARKASPGWAYLIEKELEEITGRFEPGFPHTLPRSLRLENQAEFAIGYYHQRAAKLTSDKGEALSLSEMASDTDNEGDDVE